jgi:O-antigen/teichoic acid export membrane protein
MLNLMKYYDGHLYRNSLAILLNYGFNALFGLVFWVVAARYYPVVDLGLATVAISIGTFIVNLSRFGMDVGMTRYLPEKKDPQVLYSTILIITMVCSVIITALFIININYLSPSLAVLQDFGIAASFILFILFFSIYGIQNSALISIRKSGMSFVQNIVLCLRIPLLILLVSFGIMGVFISFSVTYLLAMIFGFIVLNRLKIPTRLVFSVTSLLEIVRYSLGNYTAMIFSITPIYLMPYVIFNITGARDSAYFYVAYSVASILFMVPSAVSMSLFVEGSHNQPLQVNAVKSLILTTVLIVPMILAIFLFGDKILLLFSKEYALQSFELLKLLAISSLFSPLLFVYLAVEKVHKGLYMINLVNFLTSLAMIVAGALMLPVYGLIGIGYAWLLTYLVTGVIILIHYRKVLLDILPVKLPLKTGS